MADRVVSSASIGNNVVSENSHDNNLRLCTPQCSKLRCIHSPRIQEREGYVIKMPQSVGGKEVKMLPTSNTGFDMAKYVSAVAKKLIQ